jgi:hypothetical protein
MSLIANASAMRLVTSVLSSQADNASGYYPKACFLSDLAYCRVSGVFPRFDLTPR